GGGGRGLGFRRVLFRPPLAPLPGMPEMSMSCSWAILRTTGEERTRRSSSTEAPEPIREAAFGTSRAPVGVTAGCAVAGTGATRIDRKRRREGRGGSVVG